jgi:hypothetical protein
MFEVKLYLNDNEISKIKTTNKEGNLYEITTGKLKLFHTQSENISLTDKCEYFRFLPIQRNSIVIII